MAKTSGNSSNKLGAGCLIIFSLPFAAVGAFMAGMVVWDLWTWSAVQSWVPTPARLLMAEARENNDGDGGTTYRAVAEYRYEFGGKAYENDRVTIHAGSDNIGTYQRDRGRELVRLKNAGKPVTCYVNPDQPSEAILFRDLRPGYVAFKGLFGLVFGGVGFGLLAASVWGYRDAKREAGRQQEYPNEPWKWKEDWRAGVIRSSAGRAAVGFGIVAALWNAVAWPAFIAALGAGGSPLWAKLLVTMFPLIGAFLAVYAILLVLRRWKWGVSEFEMAAVPGVLGGPLAGMIKTPASIRAENGYTVRLACIRRESDGDSTNEVTQWEHEETIMRNLSFGMDRTLIPVQFIIPYELPPSGGDIRWKLTAKAATSGVDYHAEFDVPVFQTEASSSTPPASSMSLDAELPAELKTNGTEMNAD